MDSGIGAALRKARARRQVELSEVEAATRIRARFLRAIEEEDWEALPGEVYARGFVRTYAGFLGLDGERLAAEAGRRMRERADREAAAPVAPPVSAHRRPSAPRPPRRRLLAATAVAVVVLAAAAIAIGLATEGGDEAPVGDGSGGATVSPQRPVAAPPDPARASGVSLELTATGEVWVCLLDAGERPLVGGRILPAGAREGPFRSGSFTVSFGNGEVSMRIDGKEAEIPATSSPIGYAVGDGGALRPLAEGERPECL